MRRIAIAVMGTISGLVLLFSYHTSLGGSTVTTVGAGNAADNGGAAGDPSPSDTGSPSASGSTTAAAGKDTGSSGTFTGDAVDTQWGVVQVRIVVTNGKITKATAIRFPNGNHHDDEINSWAIPQLEQETVTASSAKIDALSGATVTSDGYISSLQSAVDKAHL
jgi:uncharacterized protein with FMN-binding domain